MKIIAKSNFPILSMLFFFFFFFFFLNSRNSITVLPIGVKLDIWTSFGESYRDSTQNFRVNPFTIYLNTDYYHTLEYKPNDIIITPSFGDVLLHHHYSSQTPPPKHSGVESGNEAAFCGYSTALAPAPRNAG